jgi:hypothetical protein
MPVFLTPVKYHHAGMARTGNRRSCRVAYNGDSPPKVKRRVQKIILAALKVILIINLLFLTPFLILPGLSRGF